MKLLLPPAMLREKGVRAHWDTTLPLLSPLTASRRLVTSPPPPQQPLLPRLPSEDDTQTWTASLISPSPNPSPWDVLLGTCLEVTDPLKAAVEVEAVQQHPLRWNADLSTAQHSLNSSSTSKRSLRCTVAHPPRCPWHRAKSAADLSTDWRAAETTSSMRSWAGSWLLIITRWMTSLPHRLISMDHSTSCGFLWSFQTSLERCRYLREICMPWSSTWNYFSGFWLSSMRIFSPSLHMCLHQRPTTAWNSQGQSTEAFVLIRYAINLTWPFFLLVWTRDNNEKLKAGFVAFQPFLAFLLLHYRIVSCVLLCLYYSHAASDKADTFI